MHKEEKVAVPFLVQIQNQPRHDERFAAAGRHIEQQMQRLFFTLKVVFEAVEKTGKRLFLIGAQLKARIQPFSKIGRDIFWAYRKKPVLNRAVEVSV